MDLSGLVGSEGSDDWHDGPFETAEARVERLLSDIKLAEVVQNVTPDYEDLLVTLALYGGRESVDVESAVRAIMDQLSLAGHDDETEALRGRIEQLRHELAETATELSAVRESAEFAALTSRPTERLVFNTEFGNDIVVSLKGVLRVLESPAGSVDVDETSRRVRGLINILSKATPQMVVGVHEVTDMQSAETSWVPKELDI